MAAAPWFVIISALYPLMIALRANLSTSLVFAIGWAILAWTTGWLLSLWSDSSLLTYAALALTGCAGVAVLGARWPGASAWNFVCAGLLAVLLAPLAEARVLDTPVRLGLMRTIFLASLLGVTVVNYLPTRLAGGAALLALGSGLALSRILDGRGINAPIAWCIGGAPWTAWLGMRIGSLPTLPVDRAWQRFRDRFGLIWGLRLCEQFNRTAINARRNVELRWSGIRSRDGTPLDADASAFALETVDALTKRFGLA
jgi:hypothetical protein